MTAQGTVVIDIAAVNDAPVARSESFDMSNQPVVTLTGDAMLNNDSDVDGDALAIVDVTSPQFGTLTDNGNGSFLYTPTPGFTGLDSFVYTIEDDSGARSTATVYVNVIGDAFGNDPTTPPGGTVDKTTDSSADEPGSPASPPSEGPTSSLDDARPAGGSGGSGSSGSSGSGSAGPSIGEPDFGDIPGMPGSVGDPGLPGRGSGLEGGSLSLDDFEDSGVKVRLNKFRYDGVLDGFEFQGWGLRPATIDQDALWAALDDMGRQMSGLDDSSQRSFVVSTIIGGSSLLLTTGLISWVLRGGALASTLLSTLPLWRGMDPLPLLAARKRKKDRKRKMTDTQLMMADTQQLTATRPMIRPRARAIRSDDHEGTKNSQTDEEPGSSVDLWPRRTDRQPAARRPGSRTPARSKWTTTRGPQEIL